ncbi:MAG: DUF3754 domain-containing protein [Planctomycetota bacterium]
MSDGFIDRIFTNVSMEGSGPLTQSLSGVASVGYIRHDADHWAVESYLPVEPDELIRYLLERPEISADLLDRFEQTAQGIERVVAEESGRRIAQFERLYRSRDPDLETKSLLAGQVQGYPASLELKAETGEVHGSISPVVAMETEGQSTIDALCDLFDQTLTEAGYRQLQQSDIEQCVGVASQWGVPLHVDFDVFEKLHVYSRGDIMGTKLRRRLRRLYRPEPTEVPIYQRMFILFQLRNDEPGEEGLQSEKLHLRLFKNIPKQDVDMLLPGSRVRMRRLDHVKILVPSLGGLLLSLRKLIQFFVIFAALTFYTTAIFAGLLIATVGYIVRSVLGYFQTKNRYLLNLTKNLYFQKLDTNSGAGYRAVQQSARQRTCNATLAYFAILTNDQPTSRRRLQRRCERIVREGAKVEVDFDVDGALQTLSKLQLVQQVDEGRWVTDAASHPSVSSSGESLE